MEYFKKQFNVRMFNLDHHQPSDFYGSCWQTSYTSLPLLLWRGLLFIFSLIIVIISMTIIGLHGFFGYWFIYLTHWGILLVMLTTGMSFGLTAKEYFNQSNLDFKISLTWYLKLYWVLYNISVPIAFLVTVFYYALLAQALQDYAPNPVMDLMVHGMNSVIMLLLLVTSGQPSRILHFYQPLILSIVYVIFGGFYYIAGGKDIFGNSFIYPMIDWAHPDSTSVVVLVTGLFLMLMHMLTVAIAAARDHIGRKITRHSEIKSSVPLY